MSCRCLLLGAASLALHCRMTAAAVTSSREVISSRESSPHTAAQPTHLIRTQSDDEVQVLGSGALVSVKAQARQPIRPIPGAAAAASTPEAPAIGQEVLRDEQVLHAANLSYGNFTGVVHYNIKVKGSGHILRQNQGDDAMIKCVDAAVNNDAHARFRMVAETDGRWRIRNTATHHYMWEYLADQAVRGTTSVTDTYTSFELEPQADWSYKLKVLGSQHYLHEDLTTGVLAGGNVSDDMASFILVPLECCEACAAYQFEAVCPPDRCSWNGDQCGGIRTPMYGAAVRHQFWAAAVLGALAASIPRDTR